MQPSLGPIYCETPSLFTGFPAEPVNTWSNLIIIAFGVASFIMIRRHIARLAHEDEAMQHSDDISAQKRNKESSAYALYALALLLLMTGFGSFLWHGLRETWALALDTLPGVLTFLSFTYLWSRKAFSRRTAIDLIALLFIVPLAAFLWFDFSLSWSIGFTILMIVIPAFILIVKTMRIERNAGVLSAIMIGTALTAATARFSDIALCDALPLGTHFVWHILLSGAAFLGIIVLIRLNNQPLPLSTVQKSVIR